MRMRILRNCRLARLTMEKRKNKAAVALGRLGGKASAKVQTEAKAAAARENGKKGGRPKTPTAKRKRDL